MQQRGPGRPSLGARRQTTVRLREFVAERAHERAGELGMNFNEFLESLLMRDLDLEDDAAARQEELPLSA